MGTQRIGYTTLLRLQLPSSTTADWLLPWPKSTKLCIYVLLRQKGHRKLHAAQKNSKPGVYLAISAAPTDLELKLLDFVDGMELVDRRSKERNGKSAENVH